VTFQDIFLFTGGKEPCTGTHLLPCSNVVTTSQRFKAGPKDVAVIVTVVAKGSEYMMYGNSQRKGDKALTLMANTLAGIQIVDQSSPSNPPTPAAGYQGASQSIQSRD
jgi:hypothetical protein